MYKQKSKVAQLLRQISLKCDAAARGLTSLSAKGYKHSTINDRLEQAGADHERLASESTRLSRYCKKRLSRVQYNINVVRHTPKLQVLDAV
jgi:hypothetical protein